MSAQAGPAIPQSRHVLLDQYRSGCTVDEMKHRPAHGFPGGPPTPPYGSAQTPVPPTENAQENVEAVADTPPAPTDSPNSAEIDPPPTAPSRRISPRLALFLAATVLIGATAGVVLRRSASDPEARLAPPSTPAVSAPQPSNTSPSTLAAPPVGAGNGVFAAVDVASCNTMTSAIGASNEFVSGRPTSGQGPRLQGSGAFTQPNWVVELPESVQRSRMIADPAPPLPSVLRGFSDQSLVIFNPLDPSTGSRVGVYRVQGGELIWSAAIPARVTALTDARRMYLIDERDPSMTTVAVMIPSLGQTIACFAAAGTPAPQPSPFEQSAVAVDGSLYVALRDGDRTVIQALNDAAATTISSDAPSQLSLLGVTGAQDARTLLGAFGSGQGMRVVGIALDPSAPEYLTSQSDMNAAPRPESWSSPDSPTAAIAENGDGWENLEVRAALVDSEGALLAIGTNGSGVRLVRLSSDGQPMWSAPARGDVVQGWSTTANAYHLGGSLNIAGEPGRTAIVDAATGKGSGRTEQIRMAAVGTELVAYGTWDLETPVQVYRGATKIGTVGGEATSLSPVASSPAALALYCEDGGKKYLAVFVLDPSGEEGPQS